MLGIVHLGEGYQLGRAVDDGDGDRPVVLLGLRLGGGERLLGRVETDAEAIRRRRGRRLAHDSQRRQSESGSECRDDEPVHHVFSRLCHLFGWRRDYERRQNAAQGPTGHFPVKGLPQCSRLGISGSGTMRMPAASRPSRTALETATAVGPSPCTQIESTWQGTRLPEVE